ncbi:hypothetical protein HDU92_007502 [Lobulomyces angularis]|nr:hypothetical protein HDU92_007502 [Lobulomyces angularis]
MLPVHFVFFLPLGFIGIYRWLWFIAKLLAYAMYQPVVPLQNPTYTCRRDVTILIPTIDAGEEIKLAIKTWMKSEPYEIIFITIPKIKQSLIELGRSVDPNEEIVRVITVPKGNKRKQMVAGVNEVKTALIIFADDDVLWPSTMGEWLIAPFEDPKVGGIGTSQTVLPINKYFTIWEILAAFRISMRNIEITASTKIDGGVCCLSGRTAAYRTQILKDPEFQREFINEFWLGKYHQHSGDDKFLTRWLYFHSWKTYMQSCPQAELASTFKDNYKFLIQLLRWTRNTWRSDFKSIFVEKKIWRQHPYTAFTMVDKFFNPITLLLGPVTILYFLTSPHHVQVLPLWVILTSYFVYLLITRFIKYCPHFVRRPVDVLLLPIVIIFNFYFACLKIYCLFTLHITDWGTRAGADTSGGHENPPPPKIVDDLESQKDFGNNVRQVRDAPQRTYGRLEPVVSTESEYTTLEYENQHSPFRNKSTHSKKTHIGNLPPPRRATRNKSIIS